MKTKWIIFDAMGVVYKEGDDTENLLIPFVKGINSYICKEKIASLYLQASRGEITAGQFWESVGVYGDYFEVQKNYLDLHKLQDGFLTYAKECKKRYKIGLLSNDVLEWADYLLNKHGIKELFDLVVLSSECGVRKPEVEIYRLFLERAKCEGAECVFFDDRKVNVEAASRIGIRGILFDGVFEF